MQMKTIDRQRIETATETLRATPTTTSLSDQKCSCGVTAGLSGSCTACGTTRLSEESTARRTVATTSTLSDPATVPGRGAGHSFGQVSVFPRAAATQGVEVDANQARQGGGQQQGQGGQAQQGQGGGDAGGGGETASLATHTTPPPGGSGPGGTGGGGGGGGRGGGGGGGACTMAARFTTIPSGTLRPTLSGTSYNAPFDMIADFTPSGSCTTCATGEYRQYVKGYFKLNGATVTHNLCGTTLSSSWQEDCGVFGGNTYKYGYHSIPFGNSRFTPNQADGCHFIGHDAPGFSNLVSGDRPEINLQFKGDLIDTGNGNNVLATSNWSVSGTSTVP